MIKTLLLSICALLVSVTFTLAGGESHDRSDRGNGHTSNNTSQSATARSINPQTLAQAVREDVRDLHTLGKAVRAGQVTQAQAIQAIRDRQISRFNQFSNSN